jgi:hypothetical protein
VKIPCDTCPRGFLGVDEPAGQVPDAFVARSECISIRAIGFLGSAPPTVLSEQPTDE